MNAQQRTLSDLKRGVSVQIDKGGKIRFGQQPMIDLPSVMIIDMASIAQLEAKIVSYRNAYEQAVETAWQGDSVRLPDLDEMLAWIEKKR